MQDVFLATPSYDGKVSIPCAVSIIGAMRLCLERGINIHWHTAVRCCYLPIVRNRLVREFLEGGHTDLIFIDADAGFDPDGILKLLRHDVDIVAGAPPYKTDTEQYPVHSKTDESGRPLVDPRTGLIEVWSVGTAFMRIRRNVFEKMQRNLPDLEVIEFSRDGTERERYLNFFDTEKDGVFWMGEDVAFCRRWISMMGMIWVEPNITFKHIGDKEYVGNYHEWLRKLPGGGGPRPEHWIFEEMA